MKLKPFQPRRFPENTDVNSLQTVKFGIDPTFHRLHVGHLVPLAWIKRHPKKDITIILGTQTAQLGDPTGKDKTRPIISEKLVMLNAIMIGATLRKIVPNARVVFQQEISAQMLLKTASAFSVTSLMNRDAFRLREVAGVSVGSHELMVPILQALDSVFLQPQLEIGGEDQLFNFELTREVMKANDQKPEACLLFPIITGADGQKMSKSLGNCIWLDDPNIRQRIMSIPDDVMDEWLPLFCEEESVPDHPKEQKELLANTIANLINPYGEKPKAFPDVSIVPL